MLSEHTFFVIERITDILKLEGDERVELSDDVNGRMGELKNELSRIYNSLRDVKPKYDYNQHELQFYLNLSSIVDCSDDILDRVKSNDDVAHAIYTLLETIRNSYNPSSTTFNLNVTVKGNTSHGPQNIGNFNFTGNRSEKNEKYSRPKSFGHVPHPEPVGFHDEIETLLNHLQPLDETRVVGIVGPAGSGKTTLAKHIYHHPQINTHYFNKKIWVCVSQSWDKTIILNAIWRQITGDTGTWKMGYDEVVDLLSRHLSSRTYLLIFDDIWSIDAWYDISPAIPNGSRSKVVITTRNKFLPLLIDRSVFIIETKQLNDKESCELFMNRAGLDNNPPDELLSLGVEMVKKCKGLPLAIVALAGVLGIDKRLSNWESIRKRILKMANESTQGEVKEILALSYYELPYHLKPCALYLSVFAEDCVIEAQKLIQMWIAEHFMDDEYVAEEYIDEMAQRYIVEVVKRNYNGQVYQLRIHDLIRQMLIDIDKERNSLKNPSLRLVPRTTLYDDVGPNNFNSRKEILDRYVYESSHVRSLLFFNIQDMEDLTFPPLFIKLKSLRVLILDQIRRHNLPENIGDLIHLRYLEVSGYQYELPKSIGNLENLLTLDIRNFHTNIVQINFEKLKELRYLYMSTDRYYNWKIELMGLEKLKKLKILWSAEGGERMLSVMSELSDVLQELYICGIEQDELEAVFRSPSISSNNLHTLVLHWFGSVKLRNKSILINCNSLIKLRLDGEIEEGTPIMFPPNLIQLEMKNTGIGQMQVLDINNSCPQLKILIFESRAYWETQLVCDENSFPQLEKLTLKSIHSLRRWIIARGAMPRLNHLTICDCWYLDIDDQGWERISTIPKLTVYDLHPGGSVFETKFQQCRNDWIHCIEKPED